MKRERLRQPHDLVELRVRESVPVLQAAKFGASQSTEVADHAGDEWRYACMSRPRVPVKEAPPNPEKRQRLSGGARRATGRLANVLAARSKWPTEVKQHRMLEKIEAKLVPPPRKWLSAIMPVLSSAIRSAHRSAAAPSDSEQFRSAPRTCRLIYGRLKVQKTAYPDGRQRPKRGESPMRDTKRREFIALLGAGGLLLAVKVRRPRAQAGDRSRFYGWRSSDAGGQGRDLDHSHRLRHRRRSGQRGPITRCARGGAHSRLAGPRIASEH